MPSALRTAYIWLAPESCLTAAGERRMWRRVLGLLLLALLLGCLPLLFSVSRTSIGSQLSESGGGTASIPLHRVGLCLCRPDSVISLDRGDGIHIAADLYGTGDTLRRPTVLLLHGSGRPGEPLPFYMILARKLGDVGLLVLSMDFVGMGADTDAFESGSLQALNNELDVHAALDYLVKSPAAAQLPISIVGHSLGAVEALSVGLADPSVRTIIAIGPPRQPAELFTAPGEPTTLFGQPGRIFKQTSDWQVPSWYTPELWLEEKAQRNIEKFVPLLSRPGHKPLLLIDGENESGVERDYLREYFERLAEPKRHVTIPESDHYANTGRLFGLNLYDRGVMDRTVIEIVDWILSSARGTEPDHRWTKLPATAPTESPLLVGT